MSIEDIDYLKANSKKQRYIFLVNSGNRNRVSYPTPSEYVVDFTTPFKNVVGMEIIDCSIPRTMYNVDKYNNTIVFCIYSAPTDSAGAATVPHPRDFVSATIDPGDYTVQTLIVAINSVLTMTVGGRPISIVMESVSSPPEIKNTVRFHCPYPFVFDMSLSTIAETLGFDLLCDPAQATVDIATRLYNPINYPVQYKWFGSVYAPMNLPHLNYYIYNVFTGPRGVVRKTSLAAPNKVAQSFTVGTRGYLKDVQAALTTTTGVVSNGIVSWELRAHDAVHNRPGAEVLATNDIIVNYIDGGYSDSTIQIATWLLEGTYWLVFTSASDATIQMFYNDTAVTTTFAGTTTFSPMLLSYDSGATWTSFDDAANGIYFEASIIVSMQEDYHAVTAPGIYNLLNEQYVILRCPEIEQNSFRYLAYTKYFLGLAKFNLSTVGYNNNRIDFNDTSNREFHPIGKLNRLTLRFETSGQNIYDFKGVNHNITFAIYYYEPIQKEKFVNSILNPNYNGNFIGYMYREQEQEEDSDDQEFAYDRDNIENYKAMEARYNPDEMDRIDTDVRYHAAAAATEDEENS